MRINDPEALHEMRAAFARYETALMSNDIDALTLLFWDSPLAIRFGPGQNLYGAEAIAAFRAARGGSPQRSLSHTVITTFARDFATANTEFQRQGAPHPGRQSQTWARMGDVWRIVSAHISMLGEGS